MAQSLNAPFVKYAADILADTSSGLSGGKIASECAAYAVEWGVDIPHATYPFGADVPNKRTALNQNLLKFSEPSGTRSFAGSAITTQSRTEMRSRN